jgi:hypothetical protein
MRPWEKTFVDEKSGAEKRSALTVRLQTPGRRGKKTDLYVESMWVSASKPGRMGLSKYLYLRGNVLLMYQVGSTLMSRHRLAEKACGTQHKKAPHPFPRVKRRRKYWISDETLDRCA